MRCNSCDRPGSALRLVEAELQRRDVPCDLVVLKVESGAVLD